MNASIITIGDEILIGQIVDTNSAWLGKQLSDVGIAVKRITSISDEERAIQQALAANTDMDFVFVTGGLGPTKDDITRTTISQYFDQNLVFHEKTFEHIKEIFSKRNIPLKEVQRMQAMVPENSKVLTNKQGTAPGIWISHNDNNYIFMPGVPFEMKYIISEQVIPKIKSDYNLPAILHQTILTHGIPESELAERIEQVESNLPQHIKLAYLPSYGKVRLRLSGQGPDGQCLKKEIDQIKSQIESILNDSIYGYGEETLASVLGKLLNASNISISTAESCTGGNIAAEITSISGASNYFKGSVVSYANETKSNVLGVNPADIDTYGAVSETVVKQMAQGVKSSLNTEYAIATSGIAGPTGGSKEKPVGTVWVCVSGPYETVAMRHQLGDDREKVITRAVNIGIHSMIQMLKRDLMQ